MCGAHVIMLWFRKATYKQTYEPDVKYKRDVDINLSLHVCDSEPINQGLQMELVDC